MSDKNETYLNLNEAAYNVMSGKTPEPEEVNEEMRMRMPRPPGSPPPVPMPKYHPNRPPSRPTGNPPSVPPKGPVPFRKGSEEELDPFGGLAPPGYFDPPFVDPPSTPVDTQPMDPSYYDPYGDHDGDGIPNVFDPDNKYYHPYQKDPEPEMRDPFPAIPSPYSDPHAPEFFQDPGINPFHSNPYVYSGVEGEAMSKGSEEELEYDPFDPPVPVDPNNIDPIFIYPPNPYEPRPGGRQPASPIDVQPMDPSYYDPYGDHDGDGIPNVFDPDNRYYHPYSEPDPDEPEMVDPFPAVPRPGFIPGPPSPGGYNPAPQDPGKNPFNVNPYYIPPGGTPTDPNYPEGYEDVEGEVVGRRRPKKRSGVYDPSNVRPYTGIPPEPPAPPRKFFNQPPMGTGAKTTPTGGSEGEVMPKAGRMRLDRRGRGY